MEDRKLKQTVNKCSSYTLTSVAPPHQKPNFISGYVPFLSFRSPRAAIANFAE